MINVVDLFSGAGGMTLGFQYEIKNNSFKKNNVFNILFANEYDCDAASTFRKNFPNINMIEKDIKTLGNEEVKQLVGINSVDVIIGGPPCQSFSTVGKRIFDDKAKMYEQYLKMLNIIRPKIFIFENVCGILSMREIFYKKDQDGNVIYEIIKTKRGKELKRPIIDHKGEKVLSKIERQFKDIDKGFGYKIYKQTLKASDFGVPQDRNRVFIVGVRNDIDKVWEYPEPTYGKGELSYMTIKEAIDDLPKLEPGESKGNYILPPQNHYQKLMRKRSNKLTHHFTSVYGDKIQTVINNVKQGQGKNDFNKLIDAGKIDKKYKLTSGYANTYGRLVENQPCTTITNNLTTPSSLRCIHYRDNRALSPREGARIQSFPDWFEFCGNKGKIAMQIGNAVPPLLAMAMAEQVRKFLEEIKNGN